MPLDRLKRKLTTEVLWIYILSLLSNKPMYAYEVKKEIEKSFSFAPARITSYIVLYNLENGGYVTSEWEDSGQGRPNRKYYTITDSGKNLLKEGKSFINLVVSRIG
ncbi:MAG: PadR family transcriptional regulator [Candidatus Methanofastidiosa archaeon]|jgi:PadR family transcriptional regulator PadR|nr:PadR family transcriptional regulator [Candidatus Methanofastidiosa archaeon]HOM96102.1 PadR family transcriptional regulator [Methanofastidiosum sp.]HPC80370.1 PadR family transcriptional regulator [Methanofastidiosum sp.]HRS25909.1 PadR family transcriptional regulator [Methanofastidiosum sp.]